MGNRKKKYLLILGSFLIVLLLAVISLFVYEYLRIKPNDVHFTNVTSSSVTVSWNTKKETSASVIAFEGDISLPLRLFCFGRDRYFDTRDVKEAELLAASNSGQTDDFTLTIEDFNTEVEIKDMGSYYTHHVTVINLDPEKEYSFVVGDRILFRKVEDINGNVLIKTTEVPDTVKSPYPAYGTVKDTKDENVPIDSLAALSDGLVYANYLDKNTGVKSNVFSSVLNSEGNWYMDLSLAKDSDGNDFLETYSTPDENVVLEITVDGGSAGIWQTRQFSYQISPVPDIVLNIPNSVQNLDVEGSIVPVDIEDVKGESIVAILDEGIREADCESNNLGRWRDGVCKCVPNAYLSGTKCQCYSGYEWSRVDNMCVSGSVSSPPSSRTCTTCSVSCKSGYTKGQCPSGKDCEEYIASCTRKYSDGSGNCGATRINCYKIKPPTTTTKKLAEPACIFHDYCTCVHKYTDGTTSIKEVGGIFDCTAEKCGDEIANKAIIERSCKYGEVSGVEDSETLQCSGGYDVGENSYYNGVCRSCEFDYSNGSIIAKWVTSEMLNYNQESKKCELPLNYENKRLLCEDYRHPGVWSINSNSCTCTSNLVQASGSTCKCPGDLMWSVSQKECVDVLDEPGGYCGDAKVTVDVYGPKSFNDHGGVTCKGNALTRNMIQVKENVVSWDCYSEDNKYLATCYYDSMSFLEDRGETGCGGKSEKHVCIMPSRKQYVSRGDLVCTDFYQGQSGVFSPICVKVGSPCAEDTKNGRRYYYASDGSCSVRGGCLEGFYKSGDNCLPDKDGDKFCWEQGYSRNLFKADVNSIQECVNGVWEDTTRGNSCINFLNGTENTCKYGDACFDQRANKMYFCFPGGDNPLFPQYTYSEYSQSLSNGIYAVKVPVIEAGEKCTGSDFGDGHTTNETCLCNNGIDRTIDKGEYCRHTSRFGCPALSETLTLLDSIEDKVCKSTGETCGYSNGKLGCFGNVISQGENDNNPLLDLLAFNGSNEKRAVLGESDIQSRYIIDKDNGLISGIGVGSYVFEYQGDYYAFEVNSDNLIAENGSVQIFVDNNGSAVYDEGDLLVSEFASVINIVPLEQNYSYDFTEGLNFISFPFIISNIDARTAAGLLQKLNEVYDDAIYSISKFDGGNWKMVGQNTKVYDNNDFQLLPGEGYVVKAKRDVNVKIVGQPVQFESEEDRAPIRLNTGWNLIGLYGTNVKSYTAKSLIEDINNDNFRAINVTQWAKSKQLYEGYQLVDGKEYGFDYPLNKLESYFVRITDGSGNWQPQLGGNK